MSIAVFPPTAASAMPSSVVGNRTTWTPRSQVAATNPARSVVAPPPMPTTQSDRVTPCAASLDHRPVATSAVLARSPSGTGSALTSKPAAVSTPDTGPAIWPRLSAWITTTVLAYFGIRAGSSLRMPTPMSTGYGFSPPTSILVAVIAGG